MNILYTFVNAVVMNDIERLIALSPIGQLVMLMIYLFISYQPEANFPASQNVESLPIS